MWKKEDETPTQPSSQSRAPSPSTQKGPSSGARATIGPSISIKGDVTGSEDLLIQGQVDGSVTLEKHAVGVGSEGRVKADIVGRLITIEGKVEGDLTAAEQIILRGSAQVHGDIKAPRVVLEDGATFRGLVDMGATSTGSGRSDTSSAAKETSSAKDAGSGTSTTGKTGGGSSTQASSSKDDAATGTSRASA